MLGRDSQKTKDGYHCKSCEYVASLKCSTSSLQRHIARDKEKDTSV